MAKFLFLCLFLLNSLFITGQNSKMISINLENTCPLKLSEIAEQVLPIPLEDQDMIQNQNILLTDEYLFVSSIRSIIQYDLSGKFIRKIDCGGYITDNVTSDMVNRKLYVPVRDTIKCYNYSGKLEKVYPLKSSSLHCLYHKGALWVQSYSLLPDTSYVYTIDKINLSTGKITVLPYEKKVAPVVTKKGYVVNASAMCRLSLYNDEVIASFSYESEIYKIEQDKAVLNNNNIESSIKIKQDKVVSLAKWDITPPAKGSDVYPMKANSFIGDYLFINYRRDDQFYFYLENMKTGKKYNVSQLVDDIFHTSGNCNINSINQNGCFVFIKSQSDIKGDSIGNVLLKSGPVVFIGKIKYCK